MAEERHHSDVDVSTCESGRRGGEDPVARADRHSLEPLCHTLILQDVQKGEVGTIRT
jgi:hypothetical protein